jgi:ketosteroid isomerase-like protein
MRKIIFSLLFITTISFIYAKNNIKEVEKLRETELAFSKLCVEKGMAESFIFYADQDVIKLNEGKFPIIGKDSLIASFPIKSPQTFILEWYPLKVEVSKSADLGYTFGNWTLTNAKGEKSFGNYMTVWKKQKDGSWKFVIDGGNSTPEPALRK